MIQFTLSDSQILPPTASLPSCSTQQVLRPSFTRVSPCNDPSPSSETWSSSQTDRSSSQNDILTPPSELESLGSSSQITSSGSSRGSRINEFYYYNPEQHDRLVPRKKAPQCVRFDEIWFWKHISIYTFFYILYSTRKPFDGVKTWPQSRE